MSSIAVFAALLLGQVFERLPDFGLVDSYGATFLMANYSVNAERSELVRSAGIPGPSGTTGPYPGGLHAVDLKTGLSHRIDLTATGQVPMEGTKPASTSCFGISTNHRFMILWTNATNHVLSGGIPGNALWLDRDADADGIYDEIGARRMLPIGSIMPTSVLEHEIGASMSDDGRHVVVSRGTGSTPSGGDITIELLDLDADSDGILGEPDVGAWSKQQIVGIEQRWVFNRRSWQPTISESGRFVAWQECEEPGVVSTPLGGWPVYPPQWPFVRDLFVLDRDIDQDGVFDEPGATRTLRVTEPNDRMYAYFYPVQRFVGLDAVNPQLLFLRDPRAASTLIHLRSLDLATLDERSIVPTESGAIFKRYSHETTNPYFVTDRAGRFVYFAGVGSLPCYGAAELVHRLDRDVDADGIYDEIGATATSTLGSPDAAASRLDGSRFDGNLMIAHPSSCKWAPPYSTYAGSIALLDCDTAVRIEHPECATETTRLHVIGCPRAGESILVRSEAWSAAQAHVLLIAADFDATSWDASCPQFGLVGSIQSLPMAIAPAIPSWTAGTLTLAIPPQALAWTSTRIAMQSVVLDAAASTLRFSERIVLGIE